jgi:hypothetical protein
MTGLSPVTKHADAAQDNRAANMCQAPPGMSARRRSRRTPAAGVPGRRAPAPHSSRRRNAHRGGRGRRWRHPVGGHDDDDKPNMLRAGSAVRCGSGELGVYTLRRAEQGDLRSVRAAAISASFSARPGNLNAKGFRRLTGCGWFLFPVTAGSCPLAGMPEDGVPGRGRPGPRSGGVPSAWFWGVSAVQAGVLAMVTTAGAMRVAVSFAFACGNEEGDLDFRARCRSRSTAFRYPAISLVTAW